MEDPPGTLKKVMSKRYKIGTSTYCVFGLLVQEVEHEGIEDLLNIFCAIFRIEAVISVIKHELNQGHSFFSDRAAPAVEKGLGLGCM